MCFAHELSIRPLFFACLDHYRFLFGSSAMCFKHGLCIRFSLVFQPFFSPLSVMCFAHELGICPLFCSCHDHYRSVFFWSLAMCFKHGLCIRFSLMFRLFFFPSLSHVLRTRSWYPPFVLFVSRPPSSFFQQPFRHSETERWGGGGGARALDNHVEGV